MKIPPLIAVSIFTIALAMPRLLTAAGTNIDVMVLYTATARDDNGGHSGIKALINSAIASANTAYSNSNIDLELNLVHAGYTSYDDRSVGLSTTLSRLRSSTDSYMREAHFKRGIYRADMVALIVGRSIDYAGIAYVSASKSTCFSVSLDSAAVGNFTFAHELGHNLGCTHARPESSGGGYYAYSFGHRFTAANDGLQYRTVMGYSPGTRIGYFSNPNVNYQGSPTGYATNHATPAYNALSISNRMATVEAFETAYVPMATNPDDLAWHNSNTGQIVIWSMNNTTRTTTQKLNVYVPPPWNGAAFADFNGDSVKDLFWVNPNTGRAVIWELDGTEVTAFTNVNATFPNNYQVVGGGDVNNDNHTDLVVRNQSNGQIQAWLMNGTSRTSVMDFANTIPSSWTGAGVQDFNGDGHDDLVWHRRSDGKVVIWYMNSSGSRTGALALTTLARGWHIVNIADYNDDTNPDIVLRHPSTAKIVIWHLNNVGQFSSASVLSSYPCPSVWDGVSQ